MQKISNAGKQKINKPIIGITLDLASDSAKYSFAAHPWYALRRCYADAITKYGGVPILLPYHSQDMDHMLNILDGLVISGGAEDIHPNFYGQEIISQSVKTNDQRAIFEIALTKMAIEKNMPILGICNGLQVINTVLGGTLIQHIPDRIKQEGMTVQVNHQQPHPKNVPTHLITINSETILSKLLVHSPPLATELERRSIMVNSTHHQAIDKLGHSLLVSAVAEDGIIEAVESRGHRFLVGVQWHAEYLTSILDQHLFREFIQVSSNKIT